ncbi:peptidoglycan D,D-transpeptidase FtsI family protein [Senegalia massiliensis]|uniref:peptidoglycan D,D-transpeptidase FtsI family protein n=1 Tax=Senegalia massiliensis TaxID=1720316 RepID=UPI0013EF3575|nr:penicillin-binding protein 2 [Senegalia massiliensis]
MTKTNKRLSLFFKIFIIIFVAYIIRLSWIQLVTGPKLKQKAEDQRDYELTTSQKGTIFDRNMVPLTNKVTQKYIYISLESIKDNKDYQLYLLDKIKLSQEELDKYILNAKNNMVKVPAKDNINNVKNGIIVEETKEYSENNLLAHVIGYVNENGEGIGVKKKYDFLLSKSNNTKLKLILDGKSRLLSSKDDYLEVNENNDTIRNSIQLTIDYNIQQIVEEAMEEKNDNGAVIVTDVKSGDILALTSQPDFDLNNIGDSNKEKDSEQMNRVTKFKYYPASTFKTVILLAALEAGIDLEQKFECNGSITLAEGQKTFSCHDNVVHGEINLKEAFAVSCNSIFIELANILGGEKILETIEKIGLTEKVDIDIDGENEGYIADLEKVLGPGIGNLALGQEHIKLTPLQIHNLTMIIANNGIKKDMSIVKGYATNKGDISMQFDRKNDEWIFDKSYAEIIKDYMKSVVEVGTASNLDLSQYGGAAGKTGTAQKSNKDNNGLFTGFSPSDNPKYAVTVIVEDIGDKYSSSTAVKVFNEIIKKINSEK